MSQEGVVKTNLFLEFLQNNSQIQHFQQENVNTIEFCYQNFIIKHVSLHF